jgi:hypothetical protein
MIRLLASSEILPRSLDTLRYGSTAALITALLKAAQLLIM